MQLPPGAGGNCPNPLESYETNEFRLGQLDIVMGECTRYAKSCNCNSGRADHESSQSKNSHTSPSPETRKPDLATSSRCARLVEPFVWRVQRTDEFPKQLDEMARLQQHYHCSPNLTKPPYIYQVHMPSQGVGRLLRLVASNFLLAVYLQRPFIIDWMHPLAADFLSMALEYNRFDFGIRDKALQKQLPDIFSYKCSGLYNLYGDDSCDKDYFSYIPQSEIYRHLMVTNEQQALLSKQSEEQQEKFLQGLVDDTRILFAWDWTGGNFQFFPFPSFETFSKPVFPSKILTSSGVLLDAMFKFRESFRTSVVAPFEKLLGQPYGTLHYRQKYSLVFNVTEFASRVEQEVGTFPSIHSWLLLGDRPQLLFDARKLLSESHPGINWVVSWKGAASNITSFAYCQHKASRAGWEITLRDLYLMHHANVAVATEGAFSDVGSSWGFKVRRHTSHSVFGTEGEVGNEFERDYTLTPC